MEMQETLVGGREMRVENRMREETVCTSMVATVLDFLVSCWPASRRSQSITIVVLPVVY